MTDEHAYSITKDESNEEQVDISKILSDVKKFTEWNESVNKAEKADNQHLIEVLTKINNLAGWNLWKKDVRNVFEFFGKNFKTKLNLNLTIEQAQDLKNEIEYLINNTSFDDRELEQQMNNLYTLLYTFVEPEHWNKKDEEIIIAAGLASDLNDDENTKLNSDSAVNLTQNSTSDLNTNSNINTSTESSTDSNIDWSSNSGADSSSDWNAELTVQQDIKDTQQELISDMDETKDVGIEKVTIPTENNESSKWDNSEEITSKVNKSTPQNDTEKSAYEIKLEYKKKTKKKNENTDKQKKSVSEKVKKDESANRKYLNEYISDKEFPWKKVIQDVINEKDATKKKEKIKLLQLQLIPYYDWQIDWLINSWILTAIEKYITKNLNKKWEIIIKSDDSHVIRCEFDWKIIDNANWLNTVIKEIGDKDLWHAYFLDYPDFEYTIEDNTTITATVNDFNYFYDIATNTLQKQKREDPLQDVTNEDVLQKHLKTIAIIINK